MSNKVSAKHRTQKSLKVRIYPTIEQESLILKALGSYRFIYNQHKAEKDRFYEENIKGKSLSKKEIAEIYKNFKPKTQKQFCDEFEWLRDIPVITITCAIRSCDETYNQFFKSNNGKRKGKKLGFPKFKSKKDSYQSFPIYMLSSRCLDYDHRILNLPKLKAIKFAHAENRDTRYISWFRNATPKHCTVSRNPAGEYWCSVLFEKEGDTYQNIELDRCTGLDFSPNFLYVNDLNESAPNYIAQKQAHKKELQKLQRRLSRKQKGSKNREKARIKLARLEEHIANSRRDYIEKETLRLVQTYDVIGVENLNLQGMMRFSYNARNYVDTSWYTFVNKLIWKSQFNNCLVIQADRFYPSSKTCNNCGYINRDLTLKDRVWTCPECGSTIIRDQNAALNLKDNAIKLLVGEIKSTLGMEHTEVMSMEDIEVSLMNNQVYGVSYEVESEKSDLSHEAVCFS